MKKQKTCPFLKDGLRHIDCWAQKPDPGVCIHTRVNLKQSQIAAIEKAAASLESAAKNGRIVLQ